VTAFAELASLVTFRPLSTPLPGPTYDGAYSSPFTAPWSSTVALLAREVRHLRPRQAVMELDVREQDFRIDGLPKARAAAGSPGVVLSLIGTPHGDLRYPSGTFRLWEDNVRALALALEALRKVDRYGVTKRGEQYAGWRALPPGDRNGTPSADRGRDLIREHGGVRQAMHATHPDHGGSARDFADVMAARG
jgi:hypothetical protein